MRMRLFLAIVGLVVAPLGAAAGQHEGHHGAATTVDTAQAARCSQVQSVVDGLVGAALTRIEAARLTNNAAAMRDAVDDVQAALVDIRQQLMPCGGLAAASAAAGHGAHAMPAQPQAPAAAPGPPAPAAADPHAAHAAAPAPQPAAPRRAAPAAPARPTTPAAHDAHAGHPAPPAPPTTTATTAAPPTGLMAAPPTDIANLKCRTGVDPRTAPRMLHQGRMYYFCSEQDRAAFAKEPSKYARPAGEAAPAH